MLDGTNHLAGVGVLVVVPGNNLYFRQFVVDRQNHGLSCIEQRTISHANDIAGYDLIGVVTEGFIRSSLHSVVDCFLCRVALNNCSQNGGRTCRGRYTLSGTDQLAVQFRDNQADCLSCASAVRNDVYSCCTGSSQIAFSLRAIQSHLIASVSVDGAHDTRLDREAVVQRR